METTKKVLKDAKNDVVAHVKRQKFAYGFAALAALLLYGNLRGAKEYDTFLTSKGIDPREFWMEDVINEVRDMNL